MALIAPVIANGLVLLITQGWMKGVNNLSAENIKKGDFSLMSTLHHLTAGIKAIGTELTYRGIDEMRQACGGAGYSLASGISELWLWISPVPTFEGVNVLMIQ